MILNNAIVIYELQDDYQEILECLDL